MRPRIARFIFIPASIAVIIGAPLWDSTSISAAKISRPFSPPATATSTLPLSLDALSLPLSPNTSGPSDAKVMTAVKYEAWHQNLVVGMNAAWAIQSAQAQQQAAATAAANQAAANQATAWRAASVTTPTTATTTVTAPSGYAQSAPSPGSSSPIWSCIIAHESGGNPGAQNPSSTASGIFQFLDSSWLGYGGGKYASRAMYATSAQQMEIAYHAQAVSGWAPWHGNGCVG